MPDNPMTPESFLERFDFYTKLNSSGDTSFYPNPSYFGSWGIVALLEEVQRRGLLNNQDQVLRLLYDQYKLAKNELKPLPITTLRQELQKLLYSYEKLPDDQQDAIATRLLAELKDEQAWETRFEATTDEQWDRMAEMVKQEIANGETVSLDEVFPT